MNLFDRDLFEFWRLVLGALCTIYALVVTARSLSGWLVFFSRGDRTTVLMRNYVVVQLLSLRLGRFAGEMLQIAFWAVLLIVLLKLHW